MVLTEELLSGIVLKVKGSYKFRIHKDGNKHITLTESDIKAQEKNGEVEKDEDFLEIDFTPPWPRVSMMKELEK